MTRRATATTGIIICALAAVNIAFAKPAGKPVDGLNGDSANESVDKPSKKSSSKSVEDAAAKEETRFKLSGLLETGFDINNKVDKSETESRIIGRGEIEISARPVKKVRADFGIEYNLRDTFIVIDKMYGQYSVTDFGTVRAGIMKKSFGLEERAGVDERWFHKRSIINDGLETLGFLDHDLTLQYRHELGTEWRFAGGVSWSVKDSLRYLQNYSAQYNMNENMTFILAAIVRHYAPAEGVSTTFASSLSFRHAAAVMSEAELTFGTNPRVKSLEERDAFLFGARVQEGFPVNINSKILRQIIPIAEAAAYWDDLDSGYVDTQIRAGIVLGFAKNSAFQFRNTFGTVLRTQNDKTDVRRYRFDSEVVVVF
jgi:hypothetical protein